ncbi:MAG: HDIG domain-containing protein [Candidatus Zixiibacteriota bacterium]|nr:MAG: HDIG domain-containing protein [candidate division Zixibacteria bacterium]
MLNITLKLKRKIKRLLKVQTESRQTAVPTRRSRATKIIILLGAALLFGLLYPGEVLYDPLDMPRQGELAPEDIVAPFQITVLKSEREIADEEEMVRRSIPFVIDYDTAIVRSVRESLSDLMAQIRECGGIDTADTSALTACVDSLAASFPMLSRTAIEKALAAVDDLDSVLYRLNEVFSKDIYQVGVLQSLSTLPEHRNRSVLVRQADRESIVQRSRLIDKPLADVRLLSALNRLSATDSIDVETHYLIGRNFIQPNLFPNADEYNRRVADELLLISNVKEIVNTGDVVVSARHKVTARQGKILQEMARLMHERAAGRHRLASYLPVLARILLVLTAFAALFLFLYHFRRQIYLSNPKLLALLMVFAFQLLAIYLVEHLGFNSIYAYPVAILPIMVTVLFDAEVGILTTIILALLLGVMHRFSFSITLLSGVVGFVACFSSRRVRKRTDFYRIMFFIILSYVALIFVVENLKLNPSSEILTEMIYGLGAGLVSVLLTIGVMPVWESLFGMTTDITLLELSDLNHPLLKRLAIEAPGTYHHSIIVGNLSEAAAKAINANSLLARVGAYYHDIGKIEIPEYFVENQLSVTSRHESLTASMSALILSSHVKKGRLLGEEADIPDAVLNFVEEHHGTMVMTYFYNKAVEQGAEQSSIDKFRYPGPRPQTRETGIAMLADAVEAASRTLDEPKPARIDDLIQRIITDRFQSGELDECPLTLKDLAKIKQAFVQILIAVFHHRVKYPAREPAET